MCWSPYALGARTELLLGHGCSDHRMLLERERNYGLGMDALVDVCSWNTNGIIAWAWMLQPPRALGTRTELWLGHGCFGHRMLLERERNYGLGMDALVNVCSWNTNGIIYGLCTDALVTVFSGNKRHPANLNPISVCALTRPSEAGGPWSGGDLPQPIHRTACRSQGM